MLLSKVSRIVVVSDEIRARDREAAWPRGLNDSRDKQMRYSQNLAWTPWPLDYVQVSSESV